ncbi:MAG: rod shape-determining protein MreC [Patescibacteria group bacterium]
MTLHPVHATKAWLQQSEGAIPNFFRDRTTLTEEIAHLEQRVLELSQANLTHQRLVAENQRLRQLLGASSTERIAAGVIARPSELPYDLVQIDQGTRDGVYVGAPVFIGVDQVIGQIVYAAPEYAFVELISSPAMRATAFVHGPDVVVELMGMGGGVARVRVPQGLPLREGDLVQLPSIEPGVYGRISVVENRSTQPEQYGYITPTIPIHSLHTVAVGERTQISESPTVIEERIRQELQGRLRLPFDALTVGTTTATSSAVGEDSTATSS